MSGFKSQGAIIDLKAEFYKKKAEFNSARGSGSTFVKRQPSTQPKRAENPGVATRAARDEIVVVTESDEGRLALSRRKLEEKARLHDDLKKTALSDETGAIKDTYLVDFEQKAIDPHNELASSTDVPAEVVDETGWSDYIDHAGVKRFCLNEDLPLLEVQEKKPRRLVAESSSTITEKPDDLSDFSLEETSTGPLHYSNVLAGEQRVHGVGYFGFSTDAAEREQQQAALRKSREVTLKNREVAARVQAKRAEAKADRLAKIRQRRGIAEKKMDAVDAAALSDIPLPEVNIEAESVETKMPHPEREWDRGKTQYTVNRPAFGATSSSSSFRDPTISISDAHKQLIAGRIKMAAEASDNKDLDFAPPSMY